MRSFPLLSKKAIERDGAKPQGKNAAVGRRCKFRASSKDPHFNQHGIRARQ
jgi:hypothetical protein